MGVWRRGECTIGLTHGGDRLWVMGWTQRASGAEIKLSVISLCRTVPMRTSASKLALIGWAALVLVMSCRTRTVAAAVDGAAAVLAPASRRHSAGRHRVLGRSDGGCARGSSPAAADLASELHASDGTVVSTSVSAMSHS